MTAVTRALALGPREIVGVLAAAWRLLLIDLALRTHGSDYIRRRLAQTPAIRIDGPLADPHTLIEHARLPIDPARRYHPYPIRCLGRSLVLQQRLRRVGVVTELRIGVAKSGGELRAHAWIEYGGRPVGELDALDRFVRLGEAAL
jgi:hypothetical protein